MPSVVQMFTAPTAGALMQAQSIIEVRAAQGIVGDRYGENIGSFSNQRDVARDVTFIAGEAIAAANGYLAEEGLQPFLAGETRRNIVTWGIDLNALAGVQFEVDGIRFVGVELADPCHRPSALLKRKGFKEAFAGRGGLRARALDNGRIKLYASIHVPRGALLPPA